MLSISIIGSGFSSLSAACYLAKAGFSVSIYEKNDYIGGRARQLKKNGFTFDMGPTFYWMPDVFDKFFEDFGMLTTDYYQINRLNPAYKVYFENGDTISIGNNKDSILKTFESIEKGSAKNLEKFLDEAEDNYNLAIKDLVYQPGESLFEIVNIKTAFKLNLFIKTIRQDVKKVVKHPYLRKILEFPVLFLGAKPSNTPSFYNFMNYADFVLGTWHPKGGMYSVVKAMVTLAKSLGVSFYTNSEVNEIKTDKNQIIGLVVNNKFIASDVVLSGADYVHTEKLLPIQNRQYSASYWKRKTFAPSALLFYIGFNKKIPNVAHHSLFFDADFELHAKAIYDEKKWPTDPLFYASFPSVTDETVAPKNKEAGIFLIPLATGIKDTNVIREKYYKMIIERLENHLGFDLEKYILFKESFCINDFTKDYNSYKGNAYGLANTLFQTHILRPKLKSKKVKNLFFTGQLTVPGPGVPPAIISGKIVSELILKTLKTKKYESTI